MNVNEMQKAARTIIEAMQQSIFTTMRASAEGVSQQVQLAETMQRLETQEAILGWLVQKQMDEAEKLQSLPPSSPLRTMIEHKIKTVTEEMTSLLKSSGVPATAAKDATKLLENSNGTPKVYLRDGSRFVSEEQLAIEDSSN